MAMATMDEEAVGTVTLTSRKGEGEGEAPPLLLKPPALREPHLPPVRKARQPLPPNPMLFRQARKPILRNQRKSICSCRRFCCVILIFLFSLLILLALTAAACYLYFQPRLPSFHLQTLQTPRFNVTTKSDGSGTFLDVTTLVKIFSSNQNTKMSLSYSGSTAALYISDDDGDVSVGSGWMPGFVQGKRNGTLLKFSAEVKGLLVDDAVGTRLRSKFRSREIRFGAELRMRVGIGLGAGGGAGGAEKKMTGRVPIRVDCPPVSLKQVKPRPGGTGTGRILPKCDIYWFRW